MGQTLSFMSDEVDCRDQSESCTCMSDADRCVYRLEIEELQTFTSYQLSRDNMSRIETRGSAGDTYYYTENGYVPTLQEVCATDMTLPECGRCMSMSTLSSEDQFPSELNCSIPMTVDGSTYRLFIAVNGRIPGPTLIVTEGQEIIVNVFNNLTSEGVTIHWHGIHQRGTPWMDGVASLSQIPIVPGGRFQYKFTANPPGTHWYHSHLGAQRTDGLFGALIVREKTTSYKNLLNARNLLDVPSEHTLTLLDWQRESSLNLFVQIHSTLGFYPKKDIGTVPTSTHTAPMQRYQRTNGSDGIEVGPVPYYSGLINGRGRYDSNTFSMLSTFEVNAGSSYRFRLIGAQSLYAYRFEIEGHRLQVIASDGHFVQRRVFDYIIIHSGERYDFILDADQPPNNYWIRATTLETIASIAQNENRMHTAEAILHYATAAEQPDYSTFYSNVQTRPTADRCTTIDKCAVLNCPFEEYAEADNFNCTIIHQLQSLVEHDEKKLAILNDLSNEGVFFFNFGFEGQSSTSAVNGHNFLPPSTPYQTYPGQYLRDINDIEKNTCGNCGKAGQADVECTCTYVERIANNKRISSNGDRDETVIMVYSAVGNDINRNRDFAHPIHLHGHSFYVVHVGHGTYDTNSNKLLMNSQDVECQDPIDKCFKPRWKNNTPPEILKTYYDPETKLLRSNAVLKDTVMLPAGGYVVIAFLADNPGYWFMHCHIEVHQLEGMAVIIQEYDEDQHPNPPEGINVIGDFRGGPIIPDMVPAVWRSVGIAFIALFLVTLAIFTIMFIWIRCSNSSNSAAIREEPLRRSRI